MELSDFAERILYGTELDEKLLSPETVTDFVPRSISHIPDYPGRPPALRLQGDGPRHKVAFPGLHELENERTRGHVLHFFANHELLALELMALMLLRFPEAPASFRMGIFHTMVEEQGHLRMYRERMENAQVEFGEIPVNAFFWRTLRDMQSPLDFVTGMSMTFEQANLDFAGYYARAFRDVGDIETADVLDVVYEEEIGHVHHGVVWFDRWRPRDKSRFRAFEVLLPEGLSPVRAKGNEFDIEARREAGLDEDFITRLRLYRASRGRPPWVLWFNPGVEYETRFGPDYTPPAVLKTTAADLALLMGQLASEEDVLLLDRSVGDETRAYLDRVGLPLPSIRVWSEDTKVEQVVDARHIGKLMPWGVSERAERILSPLADRLVDSAKEEVASWNDSVRIWTKAELHDVRVEILKQLATNSPPRIAQKISAADDVGRTLHDVAQIERMLGESPEQPLIVKAPRGASGRGAIRLFKPSLSESQTRWMERTIEVDGALVVEPWRERVIDLSWQMDVNPEDITHHGSQRFLTNPNGQYLGAVLNRATEGLSTDLIRWIHDDGQASRWVRTIQQRAADGVAEYLRTQGYVGPVGIDAMVYRKDGEYVLQPLIEVNTRWTMGRVVFELEKRVSRRRSAVMLIVPIASVVSLHGSVENARTWTEAHHPVQTTGVGAEKSIDEGVVWLTDTEKATAHVPVLLVASNWGALREMARGLAPFALDALSPLHSL